jgi:hypothetical protein
MIMQSSYGLAKFVPATNVRKALCDSDCHIMKLVNCNSVANVDCVSILEEHNTWSVSVSGSNINKRCVPVFGSNITSGMCQYPGAT